MMHYNYREAMREDILQHIRENYTADEIREKLEDREEWRTELEDDLWIEDTVTGNASGSYTFNSNQAREYVLDNMDELTDALRDFCEDPAEIGSHFLREDWEYFDVTIRCHLLGECITAVLFDLADELELLDEEEA